MRRPFVVFSLPRSRSAWLSVFLGSPQAPCGHDIGVTSATPQEFIWHVRNDLAGTCETGAAFAWRMIRAALPEAAFVVIRRDPEAVTASLARFGLDGFEDEMRQRTAQLAAISAEPGVLTVDFDDLRHEAICAAVFRHCHGREAPVGWWAALDPLNVQVDMARQLRLLAERRPQIEALKTEARRLMADA